MRLKKLIAAFIAAAMMFFTVAAQAVTIDMVPVGNPGNTPDTVVMSDGTTGYGSVGYAYNIGKYEVTAGQYTEFLNAVDGVESYGLYNSDMSRTDYGSGITQSGGGTVGNPFTYTVAADFVNRPVNSVSWGDAARFCNWLQTGTTENGAYTLGGHTDSAYLMTVTRNAGSTYYIPSENEWYKAAYYKGGGTSAGYWLYPTKSNTAPGQDMADPLPGNNANYYTAPYAYPIDAGKYTTLVGEFQNSAGPYGTFDQGGNVWEWNETAYSSSSRGVRGGCWYDYSGRISDILAASARSSPDPVYESLTIGFRVASVPEPCSFVLMAGIAVMSLLYFRRRDA